MQLRYNAVPEAGIIVDENEHFVKTAQPSEPNNDIVKTPEIIEENHAQWTAGSLESLSFSSNADFDTFVKVMVDRKDVDASSYIVKEGSIIVTFKETY